MERIKLTIEIINNLGFGAGWGDSGDSSTLPLDNPANPDKCLMRIHEIPAMKGDFYWGMNIDEPQRFTKDSFEYLDYLHELLEYSKEFPGAHSLLVENCKKHGYTS